MIRLLILMALALPSSPAVAQQSACIWAGTVASCLPPTGIQLTQQQSIRYGDSGQVNYVELKAGSTVTTYSLVLPSGQGGANSVLQNDGSGNLSWATAPGTVSNVTGVAPIQVSMGTSTPSVSITQAGNAGNGYLSSADWQTFNTVTTRNVSTTAPLTGGGNLSADRTLAITQAGNAGNGYLSSSDWQAFNSIARVAGTGSVNGYLVSSDWTTFNSVARVKATSSVNGYLGSSDWTTFNTVQTAVQNTRSVNTTAPLSGGGALSSDLTLAITQAGNAGNGYLSSSDWQAFNSIARVAGTGSVNGYLVSSDWTTFNSVARVKATSSVNGYLGSSDWTTFNSPASTSSRGSASYEENGTYSAPFTGPCSVTATVKYSRMGKVVCNVIPLMTCGSTAAVIFQTVTSTIPSELRPSADNVIVPAATESGGSADTNFGGYVFNSSGAIYLGRTAALTPFGSSGTAGTINQAAAACYTVQ